MCPPPLILRHKLATGILQQPTGIGINGFNSRHILADELCHEYIEYDPIPHGCGDIIEVDLVLLLQQLFHVYQGPNLTEKISSPTVKVILKQDLGSH